MMHEKMVTSRAIFVASTGRCSTQFLARVLQDVGGDTCVEHEPITAKYVPRKVFRRANFNSIIANKPAVRNKLNHIEEIISQDRIYVDTGWPAFAWIPYFQRRFGSHFEFVHLVRNPFETAASLLTHKFFVGRKDAYAQWGMISAHDRVHYDAYSRVYDDFSPYEKGLFHWLEVNQFILSFSESSNFKGLFRFEELHSKERSTMESFVQLVFPRAELSTVYSPVDKFQRSLNTDLALNNDDLINDVLKLSIRLGYEERELQDSLDLNRLGVKYSSLRH